MAKIFSEQAAKDHFANNTGPAGRGWNQWCQWAVDDLCGLFGTDTRNYPTAYNAYLNSPIAGRKYVDAPAGVFHYFSLYGVPAGHVVYALDVGGRRAISTGTIDVVPEQWGWHVGLTSVEHYLAARPNAHYLGWSHFNGVNSVNFIQPVEVEKNSTQKENGEITMLMFKINENGRVYLVTANGHKWVNTKTVEALKKGGVPVVNIGFSEFFSLASDLNALNVSGVGAKEKTVEALTKEFAG